MQLNDGAKAILYTFFGTTAEGLDARGAYSLLRAVMARKADIMEEIEEMEEEAVQDGFAQGEGARLRDALELLISALSRHAETAQLALC